MFKTQQDVQAHYQFLIEECMAMISQTKINRLSFIRIGLLVLEIILFIWFLNAGDQSLHLFIAGLLFFPVVAFIIVVNIQHKIATHENYLEKLLWIYQNEVELANGIDNGYDHGHSFKNDDHPYSSDLDLFGKASLYALINRCTTRLGSKKLADLMLIAHDEAMILERQEAVKEICGQIQDTFNFRANLKGHDAEKVEEIKYKLSTQLTQQLQFIRSPFLGVLVKIMPFLTLALLVSALLFEGPFWGLLSLVGLINAGVVFYHMKSINKVYYGFSKGAALLVNYSLAVAWTEKRQWKSTYIRKFFTDGEKVSSEIKNLAKIIQAFDTRLNILLSVVLNCFLLWDLRCSIGLDMWHQRAAQKVKDGLDRIGHFEELIAVGTLAFNQPEWIFPEISSQFCFRAKDLGHPLIIAEKRVTNDFNLEVIPTVDIITGSNMAGKSTFLRSVGINMVLAYLGAPVCAAGMRVSIFKVLTYMRIKDSLTESTSTFKAELNRLKMILANVAEHRNSLVLIDEMLRGTNSKDKFTGSKVFIERLVKLAIPALFATHDLQLSELKVVYGEQIRNFHFDIQMHSGEMEFDYKLKEGACKVFNAAILLKEIGLS